MSQPEQARTRPAVRRRPAWAAVVVMLTAALTGCGPSGAAPLAGASASVEAMPTGGPVSKAPQTVLPDAVMPAREPLKVLRARVAAGPDVALSGRYAHVRLRLWAADADLDGGVVEMVESSSRSGGGRWTRRRRWPRPGCPASPVRYRR